MDYLVGLATHSKKQAAEIAAEVPRKAKEQQELVCPLVG